MKFKIAKGCISYSLENKSSYVKYSFMKNSNPHKEMGKINYSSDKAS